MNNINFSTLFFGLALIICTLILWLGPLRYKIVNSSEGRIIYILDTFKGEIILAGPTGAKVISVVK